MSNEVICLSSDENDGAFSKNPKIWPIVDHDDDKETKKRRLSSPTATSTTKKQKLFKGSSPPQPGCSKDFEKIEQARKIIKPQLVVKEKITIPDASEDVFQHFIKACLEKRDDKDTKKVVQKLEKLYDKLGPFQKNNDELRLFINSCHEKIAKGLANDIYTPILDLHTEIKKQINTEDDTVEEVQVSKEDMKKIKLLEKSIKECLKKIKDLEEKEVDFEEDNDSAYIQEDKYKKRLVQLCHMLSKISGDKLIKKQIMKKKIKRKDIPDEMTGISSVDEAILSFVNSDIGKINQLKYLETQGCADHIKMPEYLDILKCIQQCNKDGNLGLSKEKTNKLAKKAFQAVGNFLKKKRMDETNYYIQSFLNNESEDPAKKDVVLDQKLRKNQQEGDRKLEEIFKKYVDIQEEGAYKDESEADDTDSSGEESNDESTDHNEINNVIDEKLLVTTNTLESKFVDEDDDALVINDALETKDPLAINDEVINSAVPQPESDSCVAQIKKGSLSSANVVTEKVVQAQAPFIQVRAFAKPPPAWGELSPEKIKSKAPVHSPKPEYIDLTREKEISQPSLRKSINPLANVKCNSLPVGAKRVVIVKNVINNYNVPFRVKKNGTGSPSTSSQSTWLSKDKGADNKPYMKQ